MSLRTFPPEMSSTSGLDEKTPLIRSISTSNDALNRRSSSYSQHLTAPRQQPSQIPTQNSFLPLVCVLLTVVLERIAYYGILANLLLFLISETKFNQSVSVVIVFCFTGLALFMSTVGGIVGDSYSGRYNAVWGSLLVYIVGIGMIFYSAFISERYANGHLKTYYPLLALFSLLIISIGEGAYKANVTAFGGDQLRGQDEQRYRRFFNWYYWSINVGSFVGFSAIAYVEQVESFTTGFAILFGSIVLASVIFSICKSRYISHPPTGHILKKIYSIIKEAKQKKREEEDSTSDASTQYYPGLQEYMPIKSWLDRAMMKYGGSYLDTDVEEVKTIGKIVVIFAILIPYWAIFFQMNSTFLLQGLHMRISIYNDTDDPAKDLGVVPPALLSLVDVVFVLILIPVMDKWIYPWLDRKGWSPSVFARISIGFLFAVASMLVAGGVEIARKADTDNCVNQTVGHLNYTACMYIYYQIPQYGLIGISEVFASVGALEFAYKEAPKTMQSLVMGLFFFTQSAGSLLGGGLYMLCTLGKHPWIPSLDDLFIEPKLGAYLNYYFFLLAGLQFITLVIFLAVTMKYKIIQFNQKRTLPVIQRSQSSNPRT
ncbi:hypothetical protein ACROYT_G009856 [Oculina patagonica]